MKTTGLFADGEHERGERFHQPHKDAIPLRSHAIIVSYHSPDQGETCEKCSRARTIPTRTITLRIKPTTKQKPAAYLVDRSLKSKIPGGRSLCMSSNLHLASPRTRRKAEIRIPLSSKLLVEGDVVIPVSNRVKGRVVVIIRCGQHRRRIPIASVVSGLSAGLPPIQMPSGG